jgi:predicted acylesterase/phospholipase RssA
MTEIAIVLPGAIARGGYEAGVIDALISQNVKITRIVATSSGALNGVALASAIRIGQEKEMAKKLLNSWIDDASWKKSFRFRPWGIFTGRGLSG